MRRLQILPLALTLIVLQGVYPSLSHAISASLDFLYNSPDTRNVKPEEIINRRLSEDYDITTDHQTLNSCSQEDSRFTIHSVSFFSTGYDVAIINNFAYCIYEDGLVIFDVSDPVAPILIDEIFIASNPKKIRIKDDIAIILVPSKGFEFYDISTPDQPVFAGSFEDTNYIQTMTLEDSLGYVLDRNGLKVMDFRNTLNPDVIGEVTIEGKWHSIIVNGSLVYVPAGMNGLYIIDVGNPQSPYIVYNYHPYEYDDPVNCAVQDSLIYVGVDPYKIWVLKQERPDSLILLKTLEGTIEIKDMLLVDDYLYIGGRGYYGQDTSCQVIDVGNPLDPVIVYEIRDNIGSVSSFTVTDDILYVADYYYNFSMWDLNDPSSPEFLWIDDRPRDLGKIEVNAHDAYIINNSKMYIVSIDDLNNPTITATLSFDGYLHDVILQDTLAYIAADNDGIYVVDISNTTHPTIISQYSDSLQDSWGITVRDTIAFIADQLNGMKILNISDPLDIHYISTFNSDIYLLENITIAGDYAYLANWVSIIAVNVKDLKNPVEVDRWYDYGGNRKIAIEQYNDLLYYNDVSEYVFYIRDVSQPDSSFLLFGDTFFSGYVLDYYMLYPMLFVPDYTLKAVNVENPSNPLIIDELVTSHKSFYLTGRDSLLFSTGSSLLIASFDMTGVGIENEHPTNPDKVFPKSFSLNQNYPNPFNPSTTIIYEIPEKEVLGVDVKLSIYNVRGRRIRVFDEGKKEHGKYHITWNGKDEKGIPAGSGVYIYKLSAGDYIQTRKMLLLE